MITHKIVRKFEGNSLLGRDTAYFRQIIHEMICDMYSEIRYCYKDEEAYDNKKLRLVVSNEIYSRLKVDYEDYNIDIVRDGLYYDYKYNMHTMELQHHDRPLMNYNLCWASSSYDNFYTKMLLNSVYGITVKAEDANSLLPNNMIEREIKPMDYMISNYYSGRANGKYITFAVHSYFDIEKVIFNGPATIVMWKDGTKTIVKCEEGTTYSKEEAIDQAILKKLFTTNSHHKKVLKNLINEKSVEQNNKKKSTDIDIDTALAKFGQLANTIEAVTKKLAKLEE